MNAIANCSHLQSLVTLTRPVGTHLCVLFADFLGAVQAVRVTLWICPTMCFELCVVRFHLIVVEPITLNITCSGNDVLCQLVRGMMLALSVNPPILLRVDLPCGECC